MMMDPVKRHTIIKEIERWRNSKLLPEHYCDFLLNLYIEEQEQFPSAKNYLGGVRETLFVKSFLIICFSILILAFSLYFNSYHPMLQTMIAITFPSILYGIGLMVRKKKPMISYILIGISSIFLLLISEYILKLNGWNSEPMIVSVIAVSGFIWIVIGFAANIPLLHFCGWTCVLMTYIWLIQWIHPSPGWLALQLYTLPVFLLLIMVGKNILSRNKSAGWVLFISSSTFWVMPEVYSLVFAEVSGIILYPTMIIKLIVMMILGWSMWNNKAETMDWSQVDD